MSAYMTRETCVRPERPFTRQLTARTSEQREAGNSERAARAAQEAVSSSRIARDQEPWGTAWYKVRSYGVTRTLRLLRKLGRLSGQRAVPEILIGGHCCSLKTE